MNIMRVLALLVGLGLASRTALAGESDAEAEEAFARIEVACTAISGSSIYLDQGRDAGILPGDRVRLFLLQGAPKIGRIESVSRSNSRAKLEHGMDGVDIGARGEVLVPKERLASKPPASETAPPAPAPSSTEPGASAAPDDPQAVAPVATASPEHPAWTQPPDEWNARMPLLAPAQGVDPDERPRRMSGRAFTALDWTSDDGGTDSREFVSTRTGFDWRVDNPFGHGGRLDFDAEYFARSSSIEGGSDEHDSKLRIDRLSYEFGGVRSQPDRTVVGRFLQREFPELGYLDGVEYVHRLRSGSRFGASAGFMPVPDDLFRSGDDFQTAFFYRYVSDESERFSLGTGYQKTWHAGAADRDLLVSTLEYHPSLSNSVFSSLLLDYYTSGDDIKSSGFEVTQFLVNATHRTEEGHGVGVFLSHFRWPELKRDEFSEITAQQLADNKNSRLGLDGWYEFSKKTELYGRSDLWTDQDDTGGSGSVRVNLRDLVYRDGLVSFETFVTAGKFSTGVGVRSSASKRFERGSIGASWDTTRFDQDVDGELLQHALRVYGDLTLGEKWFLSLYLESRLGDEQDALTLGFLLQRRFY